MSVPKRTKGKRAPRKEPSGDSVLSESTGDPPSALTEGEGESVEEDEDPQAIDEVLEATGEVLEATGEVLEATGEVLEDEAIEAEGEAAESELDVESESETTSAHERSSLVRVDALSVYMREVQRHPLLSPDDEHALAVHYHQTGDVTAAARMVTANLRLVVKIAYEYRRAYRNMMDLIQEGNIGLMQAVKRYDPYRGVKLSSYAAWWIRAYMLRYILNNWRMVKIGTTQAQRKLFFNLSKEKAKLTAMGIEPTHAEIAKRLNVSENDVMEMDRRLSRSDASLDAPVAESDERTTSRLELLPSLSDSPDRLTEDAQIHQMLRAKLDVFRGTLIGKDVAIFDKRLVADDPLTLQELGDEFGVSRERVRQIEARLTGRLRTFLQQELGDGVSEA